MAKNLQQQIDSAVEAAHAGGVTVFGYRGVVVRVSKPHPFGESWPASTPGDIEYYNQPFTASDYAIMGLTLLFVAAAVYGVYSFVGDVTGWLRGS